MKKLLSIITLLFTVAAVAEDIRMSNNPNIGYEITCNDTEQDSSEEDD